MLETQNIYNDDDIEVEWKSLVIIQWKFYVKKSFVELNAE